LALAKAAASPMTTAMRDRDVNIDDRFFQKVRARIG
jgi:hypothetical protein